MFVRGHGAKCQRRQFGAAARTTPQLMTTLCDFFHEAAEQSGGERCLVSWSSVDARVVQPYWDYTIDAQVHGKAWADSIVFDDAWWGPADGAGDSHAHHLTARQLKRILYGHPLKTELI